MSLIPYHPQEGREIVLRHRNAIVVRDPSSRRLEIRGLSECPTCHRPLHDVGGGGGGVGGGGNGSGGRADPGSSARHDDYVDPNYFRMLQAGYRVGQLRAASATHEHEHDGTEGEATTPGRATRVTTTSPHHTTSPATTSSALRRLLRPLGGLGGSPPPSTPPDAGRITDWEGSSLPSSPSAASVRREDDDDDDDDGDDGDDDDDDDAVSVTEMAPPPPPLRRGSIRKEAFSPHYFATFFVEERELGRGGKGVVLLVRHEIDGCQLGHFACKRVPVGDDHAWLERVLVEVEVLARLSHPNLVSYRHVWLENVRLARFGGGGPPVACAFILQQYCNGGDLHRYVVGDAPRAATKEELKEQVKARRRGARGTVGVEEAEGSSSRLLPFDEIYSLFRDITSGLAYLHAANYVHRDLKPSNCLLHREGRTLTCLISDFGEVQPEHTQRRSTGTTGTLSYCAPEVLERQGPDGAGPYGNFTTKSDVFSLGMILYFMCFGRLPYRSANALHEELEDMAALRAEIVGWRGFRVGGLGGGGVGGVGGGGGGGGGGRRAAARQDLPAKLYALLTRMLARDPAARPSAADVLLAMRTDPAGMDYGLDRDRADDTAVTDSDDASGPVSSARRRSRTAKQSPPPQAQPTLHRPSTSLTWARGPGARLAVSPERGGGLGSSSGFAQPRRQSSASPRRRRQHPRPQDLAGGASSASVVGVHNDSSIAADAPPLTTPLLMPPPTTRLGAARHRGRVAVHQARRAARRHAAALALALRTALFLAKMASLARPCWPFVVRPGVGASLVLVAGLDLGVPARGEGAEAAAAATAAAAAAAAAARMMLFVDQHDGGGGGDVHDHDHDHDDPHGLLPRVPGAPWWPWWDWRVSVLLFALHFVVLAVAGRADVLCTGGAEAWAEAW